jgi:hypothetical protein
LNPPFLLRKLLDRWPHHALDSQRRVFVATALFCVNAFLEKSLFPASQRWWALSLSKKYGFTTSSGERIGWLCYVIFSLHEYLPLKGPMMAKHQRYDYKQSVLEPIFLEDQLAPDTLEYAIHYIVEERLNMGIFDKRYNSGMRDRIWGPPSLKLAAGDLGDRLYDIPIRHKSPWKMGTGDRLPIQSHYGKDMVLFQYRNHLFQGHAMMPGHLFAINDNHISVSNTTF